MQRFTLILSPKSIQAFSKYVIISSGGRFTLKSYIGKHIYTDVYICKLPAIESST